MIRKSLFIPLVLMVVVSLCGCASGQESPTPQVGLPNPASVYCDENGGTLDMRQDASGGVAGMCMFPDGSECDEWAYFRGECAPGSAVVPSESTAIPTDKVASDGWKVYTNDVMAYSFDYPADATPVIGDDPLKTLSIIGPMLDGDQWPMISISHPADREEFRPTVGADLETWLVDHNLLGPDGAEVRQPDTQIAGQTAIHTRFERSPQSYAYDKYFFAKSGQLYEIVILHTGDHEDWELYNQFLGSFDFAG